MRASLLVMPGQGHDVGSRAGTDRRRVYLHYDEDGMARANEFFGPLHDRI